MKKTGNYCGRYEFEDSGNRKNKTFFSIGLKQQKSLVYSMEIVKMKQVVDVWRCRYNFFLCLAISTTSPTPSLFESKGHDVSLRKFRDHSGFS